jgi:hypothetical protein
VVLRPMTVPEIVPLDRRGQRRAGAAAQDVPQSARVWCPGPTPMAIPDAGNTTMCMHADPCGGLVSEGRVRALDTLVGHRSHDQSTGAGRVE